MQSCSLITELWVEGGPAGWMLMGKEGGGKRFSLQTGGTICQ